MAREVSNQPFSYHNPEVSVKGISRLYGAPGCVRSNTRVRQPQTYSASGRRPISLFASTTMTVTADRGSMLEYRVGPTLAALLMAKIAKISSDRGTLGGAALSEGSQFEPARS